MSRSFGARSVTSRSPILISPASTSSRPASMRSAVVLPEPEGPTRTMNSPSSMWRSRAFTAGMSVPGVDPRRLLELDVGHSAHLLSCLELSTASPTRGAAAPALRAPPPARRGRAAPSRRSAATRQHRSPAPGRAHASRVSIPRSRRTSPDCSRPPPSTTCADSPINPRRVSAAPRQRDHLRRAAGRRSPPQRHRLQPPPARAARARSPLARRSGRR